MNFTIAIVIAIVDIILATAKPVKKLKTIAIVVSSFILVSDFVLSKKKGRPVIRST